MAFTYIYKQGYSTHRILQHRRIMMSSSGSGSGSGSTMVFGLCPLRWRRMWRRILALTMRVDKVVGIGGHWGRMECANHLEVYICP